MIVHFSGAGGGPAFGSAHDLVDATARPLPMRLVNQLESGTSSIVLMLRARLFDGVRSAVTKRL